MAARPVTCALLSCVNFAVGSNTATLTGAEDAPAAGSRPRNLTPPSEKIQSASWWKSYSSGVQRGTPLAHVASAHTL